MKVILPYPPPLLNQNRPAHWRKKGALKKEYRQLCKNATPEIQLVHGVEYGLKITFFRPRNVGDWDNLVSAIKVAQDAMAENFGINDGQFWPILIKKPGKSKLNPRVEIVIYQNKKPLAISDKLS